MDWRNRLDNIQNKIRAQLHARKIDDLEGVYCLMAEFDKDNSGTIVVIVGYLNKDEFTNFLSRIGIFLTLQELRTVFDRFHTEGQMAYGEFINLLRVSMSEKRQQVVRDAFRFLGEERVGLEVLYSRYLANQHPRVRSREKTAEQVLREFQNAISKRSKDGRSISEEEFLNYYADCNATLPQEKEEYFVDLVTSTWGVTSGKDYVSAERVSQLEIILYEKIRQKTFVKNDEGKTLRKAFQYFDLTDKGTIQIEQFSKALDKFGCVFSEKEIVALYSKYAVDGRLCYDEFCGLIALMGSGNNPNVNPVFEIARQPPQQTLQRIKKELKNQHSIRKLAIIFGNCDKNKNGTLNRQEFQWAMKEAGFQLTKTEYDNLFRFFDKNCDDEVSFLEFVSFLRVPLSEQRKNLVLQVWDHISKGANVSVANLKQLYDASKSWDVLAGRKNINDATKDFATQWEGQIVNQEDFVNYYTEVSPVIEDDRVFEKGILAQWRL